MSIRVMTAVWDSDTVPTGRLLLMLALADAANDDGVCWPSVPTLARKCRVSDRTIQRHVLDLEAAGLLEIEDRPGTSRRYRVVVENLLRGVTDCRGRGDTGVGGVVTLLSPEPSVEPSLNLTPQPPADAGGGCSAHRTPKPGCRGCGTNIRAINSAALEAARPPDAFTPCPIHLTPRNGRGVCSSCRADTLAGSP